MDVRLIKYFLAVAEELNITRAAQKLHMAQPPLSRQMQLLEEELGTTLFIRGKRKLSLTEEGLVLKQRGEQILNLIEKTEEEIRQMQKGVSGTLYISSVEGRGPHLAAEWIAGFGKRYPDVSYNLWNGNSDDVADRVYKGLSDIAILMEPYNAESLAGIRVCQEPWIAMIPVNHPLAQKKGETITISELVGEELIIPSRKSRIHEIKNWFTQTGAEPTIRCELAHVMNAYELTEQGVGIAIFPASSADNDNSKKVVIKEIVEPPVKASYVLVWNKDRTLSNIARKFVEYIEEWKRGKIDATRYDGGEDYPHADSIYDSPDSGESLSVNLQRS